MKITFIILFIVVLISTYYLFKEDKKSESDKIGKNSKIFNMIKENNLDEFSKKYSFKQFIELRQLFNFGKLKISDAVLKL